MMKKVIKKIPVLPNVLKIIINLGERFIFICFQLFTKVDENKVVFQSFSGKSYSCNPRAISEELYRQYPNMTFIWLFNNVNEKKLIPEYIQKIDKSSLLAKYHQYTAKYWVDNFQKRKYTKKRKKQIYIQTWHGDRAFKRILYDSPNNTDEKAYVENKICDAMSTGSVFGEELLASAFQYDGKFIKYGSPRNDVLVNGNSKRKNNIKFNLGIEEHTKVLLFAPTYRRYNNKAVQNVTEINLSTVIKNLEERDNSNWICLTRSHSNAKKLMFTQGDGNKMMDVSSYDDMADLLLISDMLITDYSSSIMDFVISKRPTVLFQPDREEYIKHDRTFYIPMEETPFYITESQKELLEWIKYIDDEKAIKNCEEIMSFYGFYETGKASEKVVDFMISDRKKR